MTKYFIILITFILTISSCGPRSGVSHENDNPVCGVTDKDYKPSSPTTDSQIRGQELFTKLCSECHRLNKDQKDGNEMRGVCDRIPKDDWFKRFVLNSDSLKKSDDPYSLKIDRDFQSDYEHNFKKLSDKDIEDIYNYLRHW